MKKEGEKYRETQVSRTGATCRIYGKIRVFCSIYRYHYGSVIMLHKVMPHASAENDLKQI